MVEPVGTTLAALGLLQPVFMTCRSLHRDYQLTQSFGDDFDIAQRRLSIQYARFEGMSQRKLRFVVNSVDPWNSENVKT
jgi:hypothetical protein